MRPLAIVDCDREPFVLDAGDVRITFDKHVHTGMGSFALFDTLLPTLEVLPANQMIMEVKYTEFYPRWPDSCFLPDPASLPPPPRMYFAAMRRCGIKIITERREPNRGHFRLTRQRQKSVLEAGSFLQPHSLSTIIKVLEYILLGLIIGLLLYWLYRKT